MKECCIEHLNKNDRPYASYCLRIEWIVENIIYGECQDGYIVQKVKISNDTGVSGIENKEYYEAWKVVSGKCEKNNNENYDDEYLGYFESKHSYEGIPDPVVMGIVNSIGKVGEIIYSAEVFWISKQDYVYEIVEDWTPGKVPEANQLKSEYVNECPEFSKHKPKFSNKRDDFVHIVEFNDEKVIKNAIQEFILECEKNNKIKYITDLLEELKDNYDLLQNRGYGSLINDIINDLEMTIKNLKLK